MLLPCFATRWLRNEEQRPLKSGRGEKEKEAENWKSRRNPRSEQSPKALITHDFWLSYEPRTDILLVWSSVCVCVCVCLCVWCACHIQTHTGWFISLIWIKARERPLCVGPSPCYLTHVKRGVRHLCPEEDCWVWMWAQRVNPGPQGELWWVWRAQELWELPFHSWVTSSKSPPFSASKGCCEC